VWALPSARGSGVSENVFEICLLRSGAWHAPSLRWNAAPLLPVRTRPSALRSHAPGPARAALRADEARSQIRSERFVRFRTAEILIPGGHRIRVGADQAPVPSRDAVAAHGRPPGNQVTRSGISLTSRPSRIQDVRDRFQEMHATGSSTWHLHRGWPGRRQRFPEGRPIVLRDVRTGGSGRRRRPNTNDHRSHQGEPAA